MLKKKSNKRIITCAVTGAIHIPSMSAALPITPDQIANEALNAAEAGAAVVHIHARNPEQGFPTTDPDLFGQIIDRIRDKNKDVILCVSTSGSPGVSMDDRLASVIRFKPEMASCNLGTMNWGVFAMFERMRNAEFRFDWEKAMETVMQGAVFQNTFAELFEATRVMYENGTKPEFEAYDISHLYNLGYLLLKGYVKPPFMVQMVTGILGGIMATPYDLMMMKQTADRIFGSMGIDYEWGVIGAGKAEFPQAALGLILGSHVRVGLEDNLYIAKGRLAKDNAELVTKMARIMHEFDFEVASTEEAREILQLK